MTTPIRTTSEDLEATEQESTSIDSTRDYSVTPEELFANVTRTIRKVVDRTVRYPERGISESESSEDHVHQIQSANGQGTSFEATTTVREPLTRTYELRQKWEGYVLNVEQETFQARLIPLAGEPGEHIAEIYLSEVDKAERDLVKPGSIFYWSIGYRDLPSGRRRESFIRFQRLPHRSKRELEAARQRGKELVRLFGGE